ncbi:MAG: hypothetical protein QOE35_1139 [Actinomycetota bacterium]|jgi:FkbM family methyltransferase
MSMVKDLRNVLYAIWTHPNNRGQRMRRLAAALRFQLNGRVRGRRTLTSLGNSRLWAELHFIASSRPIYADPPDLAHMMAWRRLVGPGERFIDVGANIGLYTLWLAEVGARVTAVEPDPGAVARLRENIEMNGYDVEVAPVALAARPGEVGFTTGFDVTNRLATDGAVKVWATTLDELIGDDDVAGVKIDVEGAELEVLQGAERALAEQRIGALQLEWNETSVEMSGQDRSPVASLLASHGYRLFVPDESGALFPVDGEGFGPDLFALPERRPVKS